MKQIKIIFFDIDGTLLNMHHKQASKLTLECLKRLQEHGVYIVLATGRTPSSLPVFEGIHFDAYITFNGSLCFNDERILYHHPIDHDSVHRILENASKLHRPIAIATKDDMAANGYDQDLADYYAFAHKELIPSSHFDDLLKEDIYQIMLGCYKEEYASLMDGVHGAKIAAWWDRAIDVIPAVGGKGVAIERLLEVFGLSKEESMAFGDGNNDIEMLQSVGVGVAMGNASTELKAIADDICDDVSRDGIYYYCLHHHLI